MSLILGIDPDSPLQGDWPHLKMAAAQVIDPGSNHRDHAAQHLDASARHPLRLAAERSFSTPPPCAPGLHPQGEPTLHPHGEPTPCPSHTAAAAVAGHSHPLLVDGDRAAGGPPPAGCSWAAAGAHPSASDEAYENLSALLQEALNEFDYPPDASLPPPSVRSSGDSPSPPPEQAYARSIAAAPGATREKGAQRARMEGATRKGEKNSRRDACCARRWRGEDSRVSTSPCPESRAGGVRGGGPNRPWPSGLLALTFHS